MADGMGGESVRSVAIPWRYSRFGRGWWVPQGLVKPTTYGFGLPLNRSSRW